MTKRPPREQQAQPQSTPTRRKVPLNVNLTVNAQAELDYAMDYLGGINKTEATHRGFNVLAFLCKAHADGKEFCLRTPDGSVEVVHLLGSNTPRPGQ